MSLWQISIALVLVATMTVFIGQKYSVQTEMARLESGLECAFGAGCEADGWSPWTNDHNNTLCPWAVPSGRACVMSDDDYVRRLFDLNTLNETTRAFAKARLINLGGVELNDDTLVFERQTALSARKNREDRVHFLELIKPGDS